MKERRKGRTYVKTRVVAPAVISQRKKAATVRGFTGTYLAKDIKWLTGVGGTRSKGCRCKTLANEMDKKGADWCEENADYIVDRMMENVELLAESLGVAKSILNTTIGKLSLRSGAKLLLWNAIRKDRAKRSPTNKKRHSRRLPRRNVNPSSEPVLFADTITRNLMVHIFPVKGKWEWLVKVLKEADKSFNGRRLISIVQEPNNRVKYKTRVLKLDSPDTVKTTLEGFDCEVSIRPNNKEEGEYVSFVPMLKSLKTEDSNQITFYLHSKGTKHSNSEFDSIQKWSQAMLLPLLDLPSVDAAFVRGANLVGAIGGDVFSSGDAPMGSFYWFRNSAVPSLTSGHRPFYLSEYWPSKFDCKEFLLGILPGEKPFKSMYKESFWRKGQGALWVSEWNKRNVFKIDNPLITLITPTGDRPEAFKLCEQWISNQTYKGDIQWIIVDDGKTPTRPSLPGQEVIRREPSTTDAHTLPQNLSAAFSQVRGDFILIIEDDDYYPPEYLELMVSQLQTAELVGEQGARYYYLPSSTFRHYGEHTHSSLCRTGFRSSVLPLVKTISATSNESIDLKLWEQWKGTKQQWQSTTIGCIGMKGLPGRKSHNSVRPETPDDHLITLKRWIKDWDQYLPYLPTLPDPIGAVVSVIVNEYDPPRPTIVDKNFPSILLTDHSIVISGWNTKVVKTKEHQPRESRRLKILACNEFPEYEWILYYDGQLQLLKSPTEWFNSCRAHGDSDIYLYQHQNRNCIYEEARQIVRIGKDTAKNVNPQITKYKQQGIPTNGGLYLGGIHIRKNTPEVRAFERLWWEEVSSGSVRDQLSLPVALHRSKVDFIVMPPMLWSTQFQRYEHGSNIKIEEK